MSLDAARRGEYCNIYRENSSGIKFGIKGVHALVERV